MQELTKVSRTGQERSQIPRPYILRQCARSKKHQVFLLIVCLRLLGNQRETAAIQKLNYLVLRTRALVKLGGGYRNLELYLANVGQFIAGRAHDGKVRSLGVD